MVFLEGTMKRKHHNLHVWQEARLLVKDIYRVTKQFPREEIYGLTSQMRRASVSVPSNISEGAARTSKKEFLQFLSIARGSLSELETQVILTTDLGYLENNGPLLSRIDRTFSLLGGLINSIQKKVSN